MTVSLLQIGHPVSEPEVNIKLHRRAFQGLQGRHVNRHRPFYNLFKKLISERDC